MKIILNVHQKNPEKKHIRNAVDILEKGGIVLVPTETGYCYIGDASIASIHDKFLKLRPGHPSTKPFSLLCQNISQASKIVTLDSHHFRIVTRAWPGPFTFIFACNKMTPKIAAGPKRKTVGLRITNHPVLASVIAEFQNPLLITSVTDEDELLAQDYFEADNQEASWWTNVEEIVARDKYSQIDIALKNDHIVPLQVSTIIDLSGDEPQILRDGGWEQNFL